MLIRHWRIGKEQNNVYKVQCQKAKFQKGIKKQLRWLNDSAYL